MSSEVNKIILPDDLEHRELLRQKWGEYSQRRSDLAEKLEMNAFQAPELKAANSGDYAYLYFASLFLSQLFGGEITAETYQRALDTVVRIIQANPKLEASKKKIMIEDRIERAKKAWVNTASYADQTEGMQALQTFMKPQRDSA